MKVCSQDEHVLKASQVLRRKLCKSVSASLRTEGITDEQRSMAADLLRCLNTTGGRLPAVAAPWTKHGPRSTRTCARSRGCCTWCSRRHHLPPLRQQVKVVWVMQSVMDAQCMTLRCIRRLPPGYHCPLTLVDQLDLLDLVHALVSSQQPQHQHPPPWPQRLHPPSQLHSRPQTQRPRGQRCLKQRTPRRSWA